MPAGFGDQHWDKTPIDNSTNRTFLSGDKVRITRISPNPTFFHTGSAGEPYNHGQWGSALRATPQATVGDVTDGQDLQTTCTFTCPWFPASLASLTD